MKRQGSSATGSVRLSLPGSKPQTFPLVPVPSWSKLIRCQPEKKGLIRRGLSCLLWACPQYPSLVDNTADNNNIGFHVVGIPELNTFQENHGASNGDKDASDDSTGAGNDWVDNAFGSCSGLPAPCP